LAQCHTASGLLALANDRIDTVGHIADELLGILPCLVQANGAVFAERHATGNLVDPPFQDEGLVAGTNPDAEATQVGTPIDWLTRLRIRQLIDSSFGR